MAKPNIPTRFVESIFGPNRVNLINGPEPRLEAFCHVKRPSKSCLRSEILTNEAQINAVIWIIKQLIHLCETTGQRSKARQDGLEKEIKERDDKDMIGNTLVRALLKVAPCALHRAATKTQFEKAVATLERRIMAFDMADIAEPEEA